MHLIFLTLIVQLLAHAESRHRPGFVNSRLPNWRWPAGIVQYKYDFTPTKEMTSTIAKVVKSIEDATCIRFKEVFGDCSDQNCLLIKKIVSGNCAFIDSYNPMTGAQFRLLNLLEVCSISGITHEMIHAIGFYHEHQRPDRDNFITVEPNDENQYMIREGPIHTPYDYRSIMHYGENGKVHMKSKRPDSPIDQSPVMTEWDKIKINRYYECGMKSPSCKDNLPENDCLSKGLGRVSDAEWEPRGAKCIDETWATTNCYKTCGKCFKLGAQPIESPPENVTNCPEDNLPDPHELVSPPVIGVIEEVTLEVITDPSFGSREVEGEEPAIDTE